MEKEEEGKRITVLLGKKIHKEKMVRAGFGQALLVELVLWGADDDDFFPGDGKDRLCRLWQALAQPRIKQALESHLPSVLVTCIVLPMFSVSFFPSPDPS